MLEFYWAYADYQDLMNLTEEMMRAVVEKVHGTLQISSQGEEYDFAKPFQRFTVLESILHFNPDITEAQLSERASAEALARSLGIKVEDSYGLGKLQIEIFEKTVEDRLIQPTFITAYPVEVSPLSRRNDDNDFIADRFEFFIGGREMANGFSELNDPDDQASRFRDQVEAKDAGDHEAMHYDEDYVTALEYGMPPTAGEGIGIDRLVMLLADQASIKDVILFPHMRPQHD
jgi:lysyl-tRNA synthetase class 2